MVCGGLGRTPLQVNIDQNVLNFWAKIVKPYDKKISKSLNRAMYKLNETGLMKSD